MQGKGGGGRGGVGGGGRIGKVKEVEVAGGEEGEEVLVSEELEAVDTPAAGGEAVEEGVLSGE